MVSSSPFVPSLGLTECRQFEPGAALSRPVGAAVTTRVLGVPRHAVPGLGLDFDISQGFRSPPPHTTYNTLFWSFIALLGLVLPVLSEGIGLLPYVLWWISRRDGGQDQDKCRLFPAKEIQNLSLSLSLSLSPPLIVGARANRLADWRLRFDPVPESCHVFVLRMVGVASPNNSPSPRHSHSPMTPTDWTGHFAMWGISFCGGVLGVVMA